MNNVNYLIGSENIDDTPLAIFDDAVCDFLKELSQDLLKSPLIRVYKDLSALAFWIRPANIQNLRKEFSTTEFRLGRGLCFHVAPSNIPVNFAFSFVFSLLAGNANIVRVPSKDYPQITALLSLIKRLLGKYPEIQKRTAFVRYPIDNSITASFSSKADVRMIWGGDKTIQNVKSMLTKPRCVDICFADRYSVCILNGQEICKSDAVAIKRLAEGFYNDTYLMDQNACSSPQLILWVNDSDEARNIFWTAVLEQAQNLYTLQDAVSVEKYLHLCEDCICLSNLSAITRKNTLNYRVELDYIDKSVVNNRGKGGYFYEYALKTPNDFFKIIDETYQTITTFGIDSTLLKSQLLEAHVKGIDRIVPVGKAMDIGSVWDGHDLLRELSRVIA